MVLHSHYGEDKCSYWSIRSGSGLFCRDAAGEVVANLKN
jgi:hypothetical protein